MRVLVLLAILMRAIPYLSNRAFWGDEVMIALSIRARGLAGLLAPLEFDQTMPIPILLTVKGFTLLFGNHELVYRLPLFIGGCALPFLVWRWFPRLVGQAETIVLLAFVTVWQPLIYYASELKQYGLDALVTTVLMLTTLRLLRPDSGPREWNWLTGCGIAAILVSQPSVMVLAGSVAALATDPRVRRNRSWQLRGSTALLAWGLTLLAVYLVAYRHVMGSRYMQAYWEGAFLTPGPEWTRRLLNAAWTIAGTGNFPNLRTLVLLLLIAIGATLLWRRRGLGACLLLTVPFAALLAVSAIGLYPIAGRLVLFTAPLLFWALASAIVGTAHLLPRIPGALLAATLFAVAWIPVAVTAFRFVGNPPLRETTRQLVRRLERGDPAARAVVLPGGYPAWAYYAGDWTRPDALIAHARRAFECETGEIQAPDCDRLSFSDRAGAPPTLVARTPRGPPGGAADSAWIATQTHRILGLNDDRIWIFYSIEPEVFPPRHLVQRLLARLEASRARVDLRIRLGQSGLYHVALP